MRVDYDTRLDTDTPWQLHQILDTIRGRLVGSVFDYDLITSKSQRDDVVLLRHVLIYHLRRDYKLTYTKIGYMLRKDHTTVMNAIYKGEQFLEFYRNTTALEFYKLIRGENGK